MRNIRKMYALGRLKTGKMNKTEESYSSYLSTLLSEGEIHWFRFEGVKLRLANNTFLTVDFSVMNSNGELEMHEVKGFMLDDANVKLKVASDIYPFKFFIVRKKPRGGWDIQEVK